LLCETLRDAIAVDALDPCGVYVGTTGGQVPRRMPETSGHPSSTIYRPCYPWRFRPCHDPGQTPCASAKSSHVSMARWHSTLGGRATQRLIFDAPELRYPMLRGTIRDHVTQRRRRFVRFYACGQDLSHEL